MSEVLEKYRSVEVLANEPKLREMMSDIANWTTEKQKAIFIQDRQAGGLFLYDDQVAYPGMILEYVTGHLTDDSISSLYKPTAIFANRGVLIAARRELIQEINAKCHVFDGTLVIEDKQRKRGVCLNEMTTAQLIDILRDLELGIGHRTPALI